MRSSDRRGFTLIEVMVVAYCRANGVPLDGVPDEILADAKSLKQP